MNPPPASFPGAGGAAMLLGPVWYPPITVKWIVTGLIVFAGATAQRMNPSVRGVFTHPIGFFMTALLAIAIFQVGFPPAAFAILFFLLMIWSVSETKTHEGFLNASNTVDWVTNSKRWYVEKTLKERPLAIQEKEIDTYPVQCDS